MAQCYKCGADQPTIATVCWKGGYQNEVNPDEGLFCFSHQQSLERKATRLDKLEERLILVETKLEEWKELITNRHG